MERRTFLAGTAGGLFSLTGCIVDQPSGSAADTTTDRAPESPSPTPPTTAGSTTTGAESTTVSTTTSTRPVTDPTTTVSETGPDCGATFLSYYALGEDFMWDPDRVPVGFDLGAGADVSLVVYENDDVLGTAHATAPSDTGVVVDGQPIPLNNSLSGEHTIHIVMYDDANQNGEFDPETATPCRHEGSVVRTESRTIDFSEFTDDSTVTPEKHGS